MLLWIWAVTKLTRKNFSRESDWANKTAWLICILVREVKWMDGSRSDMLKGRQVASANVEWETCERKAEMCLQCLKHHSGMGLWIRIYGDAFFALGFCEAVTYIRSRWRRCFGCQLGRMSYRRKQWKFIITEATEAARRTVYRVVVFGSHSFRRKRKSVVVCLSKFCHNDRMNS